MCRNVLQKKKMTQTKKSSIGIATIVILCILIFSLISFCNSYQNMSQSSILMFHNMNMTTTTTTTSTPNVEGIPEEKTVEKWMEQNEVIRSEATSIPIPVPVKQITESSNSVHHEEVVAPPKVVTPTPTKISKLHAVTYASHGGRDDRFCRAVESAIRHDINLIILGWGIKWTGLSQKLDAAMRYASEIPPDDIIMFTDAFDVMFTNSPDHILEEYYSLNGDIIFAGECGCWPHVMIDHGRPCFHSYPISPTPYRYLNSGTWIAHAKSAYKMLETVVNEAGNDFTNANDQKLVADMFIAHRFNIQLDYYAKLFQSMHMTFDRPLAYCNPFEDIEEIHGRFYNKRTKSHPSVFHFNGGGKSHHLEMEKKLWYKEMKYQTNEEKMRLKRTVISIPIEGNRNRTVEFDRLCPGYVK